ncbi:hypothetical protein EC2785200_0781 [Escherichia coli 2785200]|nr:hypothetical protein EC2785200_0781 [Escherichia coli 2785200]
MIDPQYYLVLVNQIYSLFNTTSASCYTLHNHYYSSFELHLISEIFLC